MNVVAQNTITEYGEIALKKRITHNQSKVFKASSTSVNGRVDEPSLQACMYRHCVTRLVNYILVLRQKFPDEKIYMSKIDYK